MMQMRRIDPNRFYVATRGTSRQINRQIALTLISSHQPISRADLARRMNLRRGAVGLLVQELLSGCHIVEGTTGPAARGRKPTIERRRRFPRQPHVSHACGPDGPSTLGHCHDADGA
jgi:hypothetical protein